jgi:hypothetical protein
MSMQFMYAGANICGVDVENKGDSPGHGKRMCANQFQALTR